MGAAVSTGTGIRTGREAGVLAGINLGTVDNPIRSPIIRPPDVTVQPSFYKKFPLRAGVYASGVSFSLFRYVVASELNEFVKYNGLTDDF